MNWYMVKLVYRFIYNQGMHKAHFSEELRLVCAEDTLHAFHKARLIGERETTLISCNSSILNWKFIDVTEILPLNKLTDGAELSSSVSEEADAEMYIRSVQKKSAALLEEGICCFVH